VNWSNALSDRITAGRLVIPRKRGSTLSKFYWMPAFAGMTRKIAPAEHPLL
jgi:hypothetical protein